MTASSDKHERTIAFAEVAIAQIKTLRQPAEPRDYEVWYNYATGHIPALNKAINDLIARNKTLTPADIDAIHDTHFSAARVSDRIDTLGSKVASEIEHVMSSIDVASRSTATYSDSLSEANNRLAEARGEPELVSVVAHLVKITREFAVANQQLEQKLKHSRTQIQGLHDDLEAVRHESLTDPLTTLANRKYFDQALNRDLAASNEKGSPLSLMMIDIDHFKTFNDTFGHLTGDQVLRLVALCIKQCVSGQETAARYGGEEFTVILPGTALPVALQTADRIRRAVMGKELMRRSTGESLGRVTVSLGVAGWRRGDSVQSLIERADRCLYAAKRSGRNRAICESDPIMTPEPQVA